MSNTTPLRTSKKTNPGEKGVVQGQALTTVVAHPVPATPKPSAEQGSSEVRPDKESPVRASDILSFTSAILALVSAAVFYMAGWFYLAHWYSFWGIDASQLSIPTQVVIIHGVPSVLLLVVTGLTSMSLFAIWKMFFKAQRVEKQDIPSIIVLGYFAAIIFTSIIFIVFYNTVDIKTIPIEVASALIVSFLLAIMLYVLYQITVFLSAESISVSVSSLALKMGLITVSPSRIYAGSQLVYETWKKRDFRELPRVLNHLVLSSTVEVGGIKISMSTEDELDKRSKPIEKEFRKRMNSQRLQLIKAITETWQFWFGTIILLYFLVSISSSAIFGEWDAMRGGRFMVGNLEIRESFVYSTTPIDALPLIEQRGDSLYIYGPLGFVGRSDDVFYFSDWHQDAIYTHKPPLYIISEGGGMDFQIMSISPTITPIPAATIVPTPIYIAPSPTP